MKETTVGEIPGIMGRSQAAFEEYARQPLSARAGLMRAIAEELEAAGDALIATAMRETNLPEARLRSERARTAFQLNSYADACARGDWMDIRIDRALPERTPPRPDIRKMMVPLGPVVVYGASNFPFAYSTAGGDTACALAAGCSVVVKAHPAHPDTSEAVAMAVAGAVSRCGLPEDVFMHLHAPSLETARALVTHPHCSAVGFTGSYAAGRALFDWANGRRDPIPVFAEMGSVNPVFLLPERLAAEAEGMARQYAASVTLGVGQFCTNPGLIIGLEGEALRSFIRVLGEAVAATPAGTMLHAGISEAYRRRRAEALRQPGTELVASGPECASPLEGQPGVATVSAEAFLANHLLGEEVFGPFTLVVRCADAAEMLLVAQRLPGQLTATLMATEADIRRHGGIVEAARGRCGRLILNGVPTGVEVCAAMHHGGPFPASTDSRFSSVGSDGIRRFARPVAYQNWPDSLLPQELQDANPLGILRTVDDAPTRNPIAG